MTRMRDKSESGAALVEFALLLPVFMALVLGMLSGGLIYNQKMDLTHATREGARYGAAIDKNVFFRQMPAARTHEQGRRMVVEAVGSPVRVLE